jgi:hypothetical protein
VTGWRDVSAAEECGGMLCRSRNDNILWVLGGGQQQSSTCRWQTNKSKQIGEPSMGRGAALPCVFQLWVLPP